MNAPYKTVDFILENAPRYAKAKAERIYLEEFRKTKKALLMKVAMEAGYESAAAQEREAYAHPEYQEYAVASRSKRKKQNEKKFYQKKQPCSYVG